MMASNLYGIFSMQIYLLYLFISAASLSAPNLSALNEHLHPSGRRWKRRRKQQHFLSSPIRNVSPFEEDALIKQLGYLPPNICLISAKSGHDGLAGTYCDGVIDTSSCGVGRPIAIQSYPLLIQQLKFESNTTTLGDHDHNVCNMYKNCNLTPFPTMYWLTDTHISRAISELERQGFVRDFQTRLECDDFLAKEWLKCHDGYAIERWNLLSDQDREWLLHDDNDDMKKQRTVESMRHMIRNSGVAGTDHRGQKQEMKLDESLFVPSVKCLHSHYAHYRSQLSSCSVKNNVSTLNMIGEWTHKLLLEKFPEILL